MNPQLQLFEPSRNLSDVPLLTRLAAAEKILASDPSMSRDERAELLLAVVCPTLTAGAD